MEHQIQNINIESITSLISPIDLKTKLPLLNQGLNFIFESRKIIENIISKKDDRILALVGPCSIHDIVAGIDYAKRLAELHKKYKNKLFIVMRVYFEKPRTTIGWKGLINDPDLDGSCDMSKGLSIARQFLLDIANIGLPVASEMLDPISPQYLSDLVSFASIGARTTESQTHREMASGLSMPVGYKNGTDGGLDVAIGAIKASQHQHSFIGIDKDGKTAIVRTKGNRYGILILRGGKNTPNYDQVSVKTAINALQKVGLSDSIIIDCSHGNSHKLAKNQHLVLESIIEQRQKGNKNIIGFMLESNLKHGAQKISKNPADMIYGMSITDECIGWEETDELLANTYNQLLKL